FIVTLSLGSRLFLTPVAGFYAALLLITSAGIFLFAHLLHPQVLTTLWITAAIYFFWRSTHHEHASLGSAVGFAAACALGTLSQGLFAVAVPVAIVLLFLAINRNLRHLLRWHPVIGVLVFVIIVAPWRLAVHRANAIHPHLTPGSGFYSVPLVLVWAFLFLWIMPWCIFSVAALVRLPARVSAHSKQMDRSHQARLLLVLWLIVVAVFVAFTRRQEFSMLPALPALALLAAGWLAADEAAPSRVGRIFAWIFFVAGIIKAVLAVFLAVRAPSPAPGADIATLLTLHPGQHHLFLGHFTDLTFAAMGAFRVPLLIAAAALLVGVTANMIFRLRNQARMANCFLAGMMVFLLIAAYVALNTFSPVISSAVLAQAIKPEINSGDVVIVNGHFKDASALTFYLERPILLVNAPNNDLGPYSPDVPAIFENSSALVAQWSGTGRVFLWTTPQSAPTLPGTVYLIGRDGGREILSNQPNSGGASF
ncbi:MAG: glycosyltransferase family 39 protein, partial [Silvibacterium sp.]